MLSEAILKIENQRKDFTKGGLEDSVAQVLLHLCRELPDLAAAVAASDKTLKDCVGHLKDYAMKHQTGGCGTIDAEIGTKLFCEFYGADNAVLTAPPTSAPAAAVPSTGKIVDILDFLE